MNIVHVASEITPWSQTGGLAEVLGALQHAQELLDPSLRVSVMTPLYRCVAHRLAREGLELSDPQCRVEVKLGDSTLQARFLTLKATERSPTVHFLDCPALYDRDGLYGDDAGEFPDNPLRFAFFCKAVLQQSLEANSNLLSGQPDIFHCHDWQTALLPVYWHLERERQGLVNKKKAGKVTKTIFTIHNLAFQGAVHKSMMAALDLPWSLFTPELLEFYDKLCFLKGMVFADRVTTVSPSYAQEIMTPAQGWGLDGFLSNQVKEVTGVVNGVDTTIWDPEINPHLPTNFTSAERTGKVLCRRALASEFKISLAKGELLCGVVSRLSDQKGLDLLADIVPDLHAMGVKLILLGTGSSELEDRFRALARDFRDTIAVQIDFDVALSHRIYAGCDALLMPSRYEPCGLSQLYAMRYGTIPIAHSVGGLRDTVIDPGDEGLRRGEGTGFIFPEESAQSLKAAIERAAAMYQGQPTGWKALMTAAMARDSSWTRSAQEYLRLYRL